MINMYKRRFNLGMVRMRRDIGYWRRADERKKKRVEKGEWAIVYATNA